jgi:hypothetical protein
VIFFLKCLACKRKERISEGTFKKFIGGPMTIKFEKEASKGDIVSAKIVFQNRCPFCEPGGESKIEVFILRRK